MNQGVIYLLTGPSHGVRLVVSLWSLRRFYSGPVTVFTTHPISHEIGKWCASDSRLGVQHIMTQDVPVRRNSAFLTKLSLLLQAPYETTAYLDCDTLVAGNIDELLDIQDGIEFHATHFSNWLSTTKKVRLRIESWRSIRQTRYDPAWLKQLVEDALEPKPAVNGGVFSFHRTARILQPWFDLAMTGWRTFICDEIALQLLLPRFRHKVLDCRFNCSPVYQSTREDVRVWHFHGEKHLSRTTARSIWLPMYLECLAKNVADIATWTPADDPSLAKLMLEDPSIA